MAKIAQVVNSSFARIAVSRQSCIRKTSVAKKRKTRFYLFIMNDPVCAELHVDFIFRAILWRKCSKKSRRTTNGQGKFVTCWKRRCAGIGWSLVICLHQNSQILVVDSHLSAYSPNCGFCNWWSERWNMQTFMAEDPRAISCMSYLQRFLGCLRESLSERNSPKRWQGNGWDLPHGTLELYTSPEASPICPQDIILF